MNKFCLILESGECFEGRSPQSKIRETAGEVVFNTSHSGYEEIATDPSYMNQISVMTAPKQGNYGASQAVWESNR
ncbi:MAG: carbamoyl-phosphate synthase domain-containing protein, partial [Pseudobdellovibrionaceae bacterium]